MGDFSVSIIQSMCVGGQWARDHIKRGIHVQGISRGPPPSYEEAVDPNGKANYHYFFLSQHEIT